MNDVYLSPQSRLTLLNMLTQFLRNFIYDFIFFFYPKMCILEIQQMNIFEMSKWFLPNCPLLATWVYCVYKLTRSFLFHLQQSMCDLF